MLIGIVEGLQITINVFFKFRPITITGSFCSIIFLLDHIPGFLQFRGSSREHAALAPRYLGQKAVIAKSYARIGFRNLVNYGIIPFVFERTEDHDRIDEGDILEFSELISAIKKGKPAMVMNVSKNRKFSVHCNLTSRQREILLAGGLINLLRTNI